MVLLIKATTKIHGIVSIVVTLGRGLKTPAEEM